MSDIETLEDLATWALKEYADAIRGVLKENERLRAEVDAALALYESAMEIPPLAEQMVKALRGEK